MALFQQSVIKQYISRLDENKLQQGWNHFESYFKDNTQQKIINESKEEEFQVLFLTNLFDKCLGFNIDGINKNLFIEFKIEKISKKLQSWHELDFGDFLKELNKNKVQLSLSEEAEWMQYFNEQKQKAEDLKTEIDKTDKEIDQMVYELYGLTQEEIEIVENATK